MKTFFIISALIESGAGLIFLIAPSMAVSILLGSSINAVGIMLGRVAGAALFSLAIVCWFARKNEESRTTKGLGVAMLFYNLTVSGILLYGVLGVNLQGSGLWPLVFLHTVMAIWCIRSLLMNGKKQTIL
ncbi:MAG: hypothetical protein ACHQET_12545 [Chitinophagales bacterium]